MDDVTRMVPLFFFLGGVTSFNGSIDKMSWRVEDEITNKNEYA